MRLNLSFVVPFLQADLHQTQTKDSGHQRLAMSKHDGHPTRTDNSNVQRKTKVMIIGAGFAGLSTAYHLSKEDGFDIEIVESRNRIGGRVHTRMVDPLPDQSSQKNSVVEMGGQWVHESSKRNPIRNMMDEFGLGFEPGNAVTEDETEWRSIDSDVDNILYDANGERIGRGAFKTVSRLFYKALEETTAQGKDCKAAPSADKKSFRNLIDEKIEERMQSDSRLSRQRQKAGFEESLNYLCHRTECHEGGTMALLSADVDLYENLGGPDEIPHGGYQPLINELVHRIGKDRFRLDCTVECIAHDPKAWLDGYTQSGGIVVTTKAKGGDWASETIVSDVCVCTVPLGVLQQRAIKFNPDLCDDHWQALNAIGMGDLEKVVLVFSSRCCGNDHFGFAHQDPSQVKSFFVQDYLDTGGLYVVYVFMGGAAADRLHRMTDEEAVDDTLDVMRLIFGEDSIPSPIASFVSHWREDLYSGGAYSFAKVGVTKMDYVRVGQPRGNLFFAGEHTSIASHSTVHGAWETGAREANRLIQLSQKKAQRNES